MFLDLRLFEGHTSAGILINIGKKKLNQAKFSIKNTTSRFCWRIIDIIIQQTLGIYYKQILFSKVPNIFLKTFSCTTLLQTFLFTLSIAKVNDQLDFVICITIQYLYFLLLRSHWKSC